MRMLRAGWSFSTASIGSTSRHRAPNAYAIIVGSPQIFEAECRTPRQIQLANAFCRYLEMAHPIA